MSRLISDLEHRLVDLQNRIPAASAEEAIDLDPVELLEQLPAMPRETMDDLHEELIGRRPHGNTKDESIRETLRAALEERLADEDAEGA